MFNEFKKMHIRTIPFFFECDSPVLLLTSEVFYYGLGVKVLAYLGSLYQLCQTAHTSTVELLSWLCE